MAGRSAKILGYLSFDPRRILLSTLCLGLYLYRWGHSGAHRPTQTICCKRSIPGCAKSHVCRDHADPYGRVYCSSVCNTPGLYRCSMVGVSSVRYFLRRAYLEEEVRGGLRGILSDRATMDPKDEDLNAIVGACVAHSTGRAGWSPPSRSRCSLGRYPRANTWVSTQAGCGSCFSRASYQKFEVRG